MRCAYETTETTPGACDGGLKCQKTAAWTCDGCGESFCPNHLRACPDCGKVFCAAPMEGRCWGNHAHDPVKIPPDSETMWDAVVRVQGNVS
jgi:hypothetical protein